MLIDEKNLMCISSGMKQKTKPKSISAIINALGGPTAMAIAIGTSQPNVQSMKKTGLIAVCWWPKLLAGLKKVGINMTADDLMRIMANRKVES